MVTIGYLINILEKLENLRRLTRMILDQPVIVIEIGYMQCDRGEMGFRNFVGIRLNFCPSLDEVNSSARSLYQGNTIVESSNKPKRDHERKPRGGISEKIQRGRRD